MSCPIMLLSFDSLSKVYSHSKAYLDFYDVANLSLFPVSISFDWEPAWAPKQHTDATATTWKTNERNYLEHASCKSWLKSLELMNSFHKTDDTKVGFAFRIFV